MKIKLAKINFLQKILIKISLLFVLLYNKALAAPSVADISDNLLGTTRGLHDFIQGVSLVAGVGLLLGSFIQYRDHKRNPNQVRLSTPVVFFILGLTLVALPYISRLSAAWHYLATVV